MKASLKTSGVKFLSFLFVMLLALSGPGAERFAEAHASTFARAQESPRVLTMPQGTRRRRRARADRRRRRGIRSAFKKAGLSAGRGGRRFGRNVARGRLARGGKEFGKGMGGFGKHTGKGVSRTMKRVFKP